jgi:hypothetical protein
LAANIQAISLYRTFGIWEDGLTWSGPEGASQSFKAGVPLYYSSGLLLTLAADNSVIAGISLAAATGVTGSATNFNCQFTLPSPNATFRITVANYSSSTVALATGSPSSLTIGSTYALSFDSASGYWYARISGGNASVIYLGPGTDQNSVVNGWGEFQILPASTVYQP